jgi:hypothetical protein
MAMTWTSLTSAKGVSGSIANFVNYSKLDINTVLDEAQALIYSILRVREMRSSFYITVTVGQTNVALPANFQDPIGDIFFGTANRLVKHKDENAVRNARSFQESSGSLGGNPFTTTLGSSLVSVNIPNHGFRQAGAFYSSGGTVVGGVTPVGTFEIQSITDANNFVVDMGTVATSGATGGGSAAIYTCDNITQGSPSWWSIWDEKIQFDAAFAQQYTGSLLYFRSLPLLSATNLSNFLTNRYPHVLRTACVTSAADFMKDDAEYNKGYARLQVLIQRVQVEYDLLLRGADIQTENP